MIQGQLPLADWEALSLADRAQLMAAAVRNGYTDIRSIKAAYANFQNQRQQTGNRYDEGGSVNTDEDTYHDSFYEWKNAISEHMGLDIDNDRTYDYMSFYYDNPAKAWAMVNGDPDAHFTDRFKTAEHPTFSTESDLSGKYDHINNPLVATGGTWTENPNTFTLPTDWYKGPSIPERISYLENAENNGVTMFMPDGSLPTLYNNEPWGGVLPELTVTNQKAYGGNLFKTGGNKGKKKGITQQELQRRKNYYRQQLIIRGLRGAQLEAVLANMEVESTFDPGAHNDASGARGLMQWLGSRKPKSWSEKDQLDYIAATYNRFGGNEWLDKKAWKRFNETTDPAEAARLFRRYWERPERSSWNATDALFKNSKGSYLPQDVNDLVAQVSNLQYDKPKAPVFTEEDQRLLDTPALAIVNPEYEDTQDPDYKPSALQESIKLDESLWRDPANNWALYNQFANMQQGSSQDDPLSWMTTMASLSPNTTPEQKEAASTMYQLFAPQDGDYMYHGLNFAAYGGKVNRFDGYGNSHLNAVRSSNPRRDGYYIADGAGTRREITYEQALELAKNNPNLVVNYYKDNVGGTGRLHWDESQNQFVDNNEYFGKELDNVDVVKFVNQPTRQLTDAIPISTPVLEYRPDITPYVDFTNTDQNMFHRRDAANADSAVREALSSDVVDHVYDYMMPSTWAGAADKLFDHDENGNLKYNFFTDFNKVFNPAYDNQGFVGLVGADEWADEHPEATALINTGVDLALPFGIKGTKAAAGFVSNRFNTYRLANEPSRYINYNYLPASEPQVMSFEDVVKPSFEQASNDIHVSANFFDTPNSFTYTKNWQDLFRQYTENAKKTSGNIKRTVPANNKSFVETNFKTNPDLRLRLSLSSPATLLNNDIGNMTVQEVINTYGPEAEYWKKLYDVAKAHNFEGKYFNIAEKAQGNIATMFSLNPQDPDIIAAINNAKSIYDIPEYRARFEKFGTLGNTFIEDALNRLNNVKLQGKTKDAVITGQHGVYGGAYAIPDPVSPIVGIRDTDSSNYVKSVLEHEFGHAAHGMRYQPKWMERHNESIRPIPKRVSDTPGNKYMNEMDEIVTRAKTAVRYANENRLPGESLDSALERLTKEMDTADPNVPGDFRQLKLFFEENSLINFLQKFVGGIAIPATVAPAVMNSGGNN